MGQVIAEQPWKVNSQLDFGKDVNWTGDGLVEIVHLQFYYGTAPLKKVCTLSLEIKNLTNLTKHVYFFDLS
jgi:hypothetical protein